MPIKPSDGVVIRQVPCRLARSLARVWNGVLNEDMQTLTREHNFLIAALLYYTASAFVCRTSVK